VWHASIAPRGIVLAESTLRRFAVAALDAVGDAKLGEYEEYSGRAFHLRRRLSLAEQALVGDVVDVRGTPEAERRLRPVRHLLPAGWAA
jgi:hypothetical protein